MTPVNLNIILIITFLLIIIIILSSLKICNNPVKSKNINIDNRFVDQRYSYISEPFETLPTKDPVIQEFGKLADNNYNKKLLQTIDQEKQNKNIKELEVLIDTLENKIKVLSQIW
jgi:hypothetical protein